MTDLREMLDRRSGGTLQRLRALWRSAALGAPLFIARLFAVLAGAALIVGGALVGLLPEAVYRISGLVMINTGIWAIMWAGYRS
jgi:hypothetical protein